ncbi:MAG: low-complexity tail membrane protein [Tildeniella nuda ZEHNDER 1965/U140]|nr:low-complexity tail membrane protein [Tildeniella nuda ZEHNDER 1965/U140]
MRSFWSDPYLWIHLAGLAAFPLFLEGCLIGFALGDPFLPVWLELLLVAAIGVVPILWMQWQRPFYIFSLMAASVKPDALTDEQRRLLTLFKLPRNRILAVLVAIALLVVLEKIYDIAPIAVTSVSFLPASHGLGLLLAAAAFFACNLFVQVPMSVASVMLSSESAFATTRPHPLEDVRLSFTIIGLQLKQILPSVIPDVQPTLATATHSKPAEAAIEPFQSDSTSTDSADSLTNDMWSDTGTAIDHPALKTETFVVSETDTPRTELETEPETDFS